MAVIINELEVAVAPDAESTGEAGGGGEQPPPAPALTPQQVRNLQRWLAARLSRIRAH